MSLADLARRIAGVSRLTVLTGAGVSAASGVPTFRGAGGLWRQYRAEDLATPDAFQRHPQLVWEWYASRRAIVAGCAPNAAHRVLAEWSRRRSCTVITQNVDDLHLRAGTERLIRLHGSLWELRCSGRRDDGAGLLTGACDARWRDERVTLDSLPRCPQCGALARPAVVWFGEALDARDLDAAMAATRCDLFVTVGTSALVYPAAGLLHDARRAGAMTADINAEPTPAAALVDMAITGGAEDILPQLDLLAST
jgi:NAD-dependent SIR2 family protein deacetylase